MDEEQKDRLLQRLTAIHQRIQWMADEEARSAWVNGLAAQGIYFEEKERLLEEAESILNQIQGDIPGT